MMLDHTGIRSAPWILAALLCPLPTGCSHETDAGTHPSSPTNDASTAHDAGGSSDGDASIGCIVGVSPITRTAQCAEPPNLCGTSCDGVCVDLASDSDNCGRCGRHCSSKAACNQGTCGEEPSELVASSPGCRSIRLVLDDAAITWVDLGHGTIRRISTDGTGLTEIATGLLPAAIYTTGTQPLFVNNQPVGTGIVVHSGRVYWIEADDSPSVDASGFAHGGAGTSIRSAPLTSGALATTLLPKALAPEASPLASGADGGTGIEISGEKPPISAIALSPDAQWLYFAAGTRLYKIPSTGAVTAADVTDVGFTSGPERGFATSLAADDRHLYFTTTVDSWVEIFDFTTTCNPTPNAGYTCPQVVFGSHPIPLLDTLVVKDGFLAWAKEGNVWRADLSVADPTVDGHFIYSDTRLGFGVTGFAITSHYAYFAENNYVEKGGFAPANGSGPPRAQILAREQPWPSSLAADGNTVYWTTSNCDIASLADSPQ